MHGACCGSGWVDSPGEVSKKTILKHLYPAAAWSLMVLLGPTSAYWLEESLGGGSGLGRKDRIPLVH